MPKNEAEDPQTFFSRTVWSADHLDQMAEGEWEMRYRQIGDGVFNGQLQCLRLGTVTILRERLNLEVLQETRSQSSSLFCAFPLAAENGWRINSTLETGENVAIRSGTTELLSVPGAHNDLVSIETNTRDFSSLYLEEGIKSRKRTDADRQISDWLCSILEFASMKPSMTSQETSLLEDLSQDAITAFALRFGEDAPRTLNRQRQFRHMQTILTLMEDSKDAPATLSAISRQTDISETDAAQAIRSMTGRSPLNWLKVVRLNSARRDLLNAEEGEEINVSSVATKWGFFHFGRFAKNYRHQFCETPSQTLYRSAQTGQQAQ